MSWWTGEGPPAVQLAQGAAFQGSPQGSTKPAPASAGGPALRQAQNLSKPCSPRCCNGGRVGGKIL